jgi:hypothetical protein
MIKMGLRCLVAWRLASLLVLMVQYNRVALAGLEEAAQLCLHIVVAD